MQTVKKDNELLTSEEMGYLMELVLEANFYHRSEKVLTSQEQSKLWEKLKGLKQRLK